MKRLLPLLFILFLLSFLGFLIIGFFEPIHIQWQGWQINIDIITLLGLWIASTVIVLILWILFRFPNRLRNFFKDQTVQKSAQYFADASIAFIKEEFDKAKNYLSKVKHSDIKYMSEILTAQILVKQHQRLQLDEKIRYLMRQYPDKHTEIYSLYTQWLLQFNDTSRAFDLIQSELEANPNNKKSWLEFLELSEQTGNFKYWDKWEKSAESNFNKNQLNQLHIGLTSYKLKHTTNKQTLKSLWNSLPNKIQLNEKVVKTYVSQAIYLDVSIDFFDFMCRALKSDWDEECLWTVVNHHKLDKIKETIEWLKKHYPISAGDKFYLCMAVLWIRLNHWETAKEYLQRINNDYKNRHTFILLEGCVSSHLKKNELSNHWKQLMVLENMAWITETFISVTPETQV